MRVFITGASGFIGTALTRDLIAAGHQVLGLTRTDAGEAALAALDAEPYRGDLNDLEGLKRGAAAADAVAHLAFNHDFSTYQANCDDDVRVIGALGEALAGSNRPLLVTSGTGAAPDLTEDDPPAPSPRAASEHAAQALSAKGVNAGVVRLPQVHDTSRFGLISQAVEAAMAKGVSAYVGEGANRWAASHVSDTARLYRLALERAAPGAVYHAVAEEGVAMRDIAEAIGRRLDVPVKSIPAEEAASHFGFMAMFLGSDGRDGRATGALTRQRLDWTPAGPGLIADLETAPANT
ncbi:MAG: SDR family oxidoreductase [Caulobacteraceae bacterium]